MPDDDGNKNCPPCIVIINGEQGLAAIARANSLRSDLDTSSLEAAIEASCELSTFTTLVKLIRHEPVPLKVLNQIVEFHSSIAISISNMNQAQVNSATEELRELNLKLAGKVSLD